MHKLMSMFHLNEETREDEERADEEIAKKEEKYIRF